MRYFYLTAGILYLAIAYIGQTFGWFTSEASGMEGMGLIGLGAMFAGEIKEKVQSVNLDANESAFFARELEYIKARTYDKLYPEYKAQRLIPVETDAGSGAESITYRQYDAVGIMKIISNYADDLPRADVYGQEFTTPVRSLGGSYGYNIQEIRNAQYAGKPLKQRKANAVRTAYEQIVNKIGWFAKSDDPEYGGLTGLLYAPNITTATAPQDSDTDGTEWIYKTPDEILKDMNDTVANMVELTKGVEVPDTLLLPIKQYSQIATTARSANSDTTILQFFLNNNPTIKTVEWVNELKDVSPLPSAPDGSDTADVMVVYRKSTDKLGLQIPQAFEQFPAQERNLEFVVPAHARIGGVVVYYPLSVSILEGI